MGSTKKPAAKAAAARVPTAATARMMRSRERVRHRGIPTEHPPHLVGDGGSWAILCRRRSSTATTAVSNKCSPSDSFRSDLRPVGPAPCGKRLMQTCPQGHCVWGGSRP